MKSFKYFDLNNNGTVEPEEFAKAIEKIGIMIPTRQVSAEKFIHGLGGARPVTRCLPKDMPQIINIIYRI